MRAPGTATPEEQRRIAPVGAALSHAQPVTSISSNSLRRISAFLHGFPSHPRVATADTYAFLAHTGLPTALRAYAASRAAQTGVHLHEILITEGHLSEDAYVTAIAGELSLPVVTHQAVLPPPRLPTDIRSLKAAGGIVDGRRCDVIDARAYSPVDLAHFARTLLAGGRVVALAGSRTIEKALIRQHRPTLQRTAIFSLWRSNRSMSAREPAPGWLPALVIALGSLFVAAFLVTPRLTMAVASLLLAVPFLAISLIRLLAASEIARSRRYARPREPTSANVRSDDHSLPVYSVLVPLFDEVSVLPRLVASLRALDYPPEKLDIVLVLETVDLATRLAAERLELPGNVRLVTVWPGGPRTKPKALNWALQLARGDFVVVYDAEDRPEPGQLRDALAAFDAAGPDVACVQARLNIDNWSSSFYSRQFTIEYSVLFDGLLPALSRLSLPIPLGGTSNHFRTAQLRQLGAWDPFNVTEDADLGVRMSRQGYRTVAIQSTTWEEAPETGRIWFGQRTRWLKGWMQTYLVHMRRPLLLLRELGLRQWLGFQVLMAGILGSVLVYPFFLLLTFADIASGRLLQRPTAGVTELVWLVAWINLGLGFASSMLAAALAVARRGRTRLIYSVLLMPLYWLLISFAGYRALVEYLRRPFHWEKTQHGRITAPPSPVASPPQRRS